MKQPFSSVWTREPRTSKSPTLSRTQIVRAAVELLDAEGLNALSMRRLGAKLGSGATSIYWHVANKDELLELVLDEFYGEFKLLETHETTEWRHAATLFAYGMRDALFRHPWAMPLVGTMPAVGPNAMQLMSRLNGTFARAGFQDFERDYAASTLLSYVAGITVPEISLLNALAGSGMTVAEWHETTRPTVEKAAADYPELRARYAAIDINASIALGFEFGLSCILDGLEARLNRRAQPAASPLRSPETSRDDEHVSAE
ncbi:TetR/AcrR family transcriptional regulator [Streptosporangium subroseum]|uniref:TetR/AcrR family transcriptional regulator n=1 Tax=Streptosporangium subroseum TaxID=106412 RepID=UPI0030849B07|nr:TetR/AcrR family transcriptional regulator [Streptosporangium subroseum]